jgi:peptidoglycan/LPS O-acetylase OafA/YrhL
MPGLDGLRAIAVAWVVWHHTAQPLDWLPLTQNGFLGVDVFFVLSGFLINTLLLRERQRTGRISLRDFYIRRSLRIFPLYYAVVALVFGYAMWRGSAASRESLLDDLPYLLTYTSNWVSGESILKITWSLSVEEQFYLVWPPLLVLLGVRRSLALLVAFLAFNQLINFGLLHRWLGSLAGLAALQSTFTPIVLGVLLAFALDRPGLRAAAQQATAGVRLWGWVVAFVAVANIPGDLQGLPRLSVHLVSALLLAGIVLQPHHRLVRWLEVRPLVMVGVVSYGIYLLHMPVLSLVDRLQWPSSSIFPVTFGVTLAVAMVSFRWYEQPIIRLKSVLTGGRPSRLAPADSNG